jgi:Tol biopolymer transport system component
MPDWAPDDSWLVSAYSPNPCNVPTCVEDEGFRQAIWRKDSDGSDQRLLGAPDAFDSEIRLSPDGREVVFDRFDASKQLNMFMIRDLATGAERRVTTTNDGDIEHPDWTRDGGSIIYNTNNHELELIQTVPANDPAAKPRTLYGDDSHTGYKPAYSPDGSRIVFGCDGNLCLMNADGSKVVTLVGPVGFELNHFAWGATPKAAR